MLALTGNRSGSGQVKAAVVQQAVHVDLPVAPDAGPRDDHVVPVAVVGRHVGDHTLLVDVESEPENKTERLGYVEREPANQTERPGLCRKGTCKEDRATWVM